MKTIKITKMQGCGNDFVIMDYEEYLKTGMALSELAKKICDRNFGIGADVTHPLHNEAFDFDEECLEEAVSLCENIALQANKIKL